MAFGFNSGATPVAAPTMQTLSSAYIDFTSASAPAGWAQQYLPDLMEKEAEIFGNRSVSGFLEMVGAEEAMTSDQVVWSEQGRLHLSGTGAQDSTDGTFTIDADADAVATSDIGIRIGDMVLISTAADTARGYVTDVYTASTSSLTTGQFTAKCYDSDTFVNAGIAVSTDVSVMVFGSEYEKGKKGRSAAIKPTFKSYSNQPIIMKDKYEVSGSDASQIGWVEVSGEDGQSGYLWYLKAAGDTKTRFTDYCEMALVESVKAAASSGVDVIANSNLKGTEGLFAAVEARGHVQWGFQTSLTAGNEIALSDFDDVIKEFDKQGAIEEYMIFCNRTYALEVDDLLATMNADTSGTSYGVFNNEADMALNLGFTGFRRGSYDFYKTDWKYLNDASTRGSVIDASAVSSSAATGRVHGMFVPAGTSTVYDQQLGKNLKRPFLHVRYRASQADDRRFKTWTTGSVGAESSDLDAMEMHFLTERCLVVQGANNFMMIRG